MVTTFTLSEDSKNKLNKEFLRLTANPYKSYVEFKRQIEYLIKNYPELFSELKAYFSSIQLDRCKGVSHVHLIKNMPVDLDIPRFERSKSVEDKYLFKKTFVGEAILETAGLLTSSPLLAYDTRTNGDFFHDVYPIDKYVGTQTQKTDGELFFHNDRTAHPIRADYLHLLGMTPNLKNNIYTGYIDGRNILNYLTDEEQAFLREPYYITPFDEYSKDSNQNQIDSEFHPILIDEYSFRYYDTRTTFIPDAPIEYIKALLSLKNALTKAHKECIKITQGDLFLFANLQGLHSKQLIEINDKDEAKHRWILKTYNFKNNGRLEEFKNYFHKDVLGLVDDSLI